jgi:hypothetical protein
MIAYYSTYAIIYKVKNKFSVEQKKLYTMGTYEYYHIYMKFKNWQK